MTVATRTSSTIAPGFTQASLANSIRDALVAVGFTAVDSYLSTDECRVVSWQVNAEAAKGTAYLLIKVTTAFTTNVTLYDGWNASTHVGTNASGVQTVLSSPASTQSFAVEGFNHPELKAITLKGTSGSNTAYGFIGVARPANKLVTWDENSSLYAGLLGGVSSSAANSQGIWLCGINPASVVTSSLLSGKMFDAAVAGAVSGKRDLLPGVFLSHATGGVLARTSDDIAWAAIGGLTPGDTVQITPGVEEYAAIFPIGATPGFAVRVI
jgi:hypothetical protein